MERDGAHYKRKLQRKFRRPGNVHAHLIMKKQITVRSSARRKKRQPSNSELTLSMYSTLMMRHCRMEGPTGGILMARPCHVSLRRAPTISPHSVATTACFCFMVPLAMKVCVCVMYAFGTTDRDVALSNSANTGMTSPRTHKRGLAFVSYKPNHDSNGGASILTWCVPLAVYLRGDGHLATVSVPDAGHLLFGSSLRSLWTKKKRELENRVDFGRVTKTCCRISPVSWACWCRWARWLWTLSWSFSPWPTGDAA